MEPPDGHGLKEPAVASDRSPAATQGMGQAIHESVSVSRYSNITEIIIFYNFVNFRQPVDLPAVADFGPDRDATTNGANPPGNR